MQFDVGSMRQCMHAPLDECGMGVLAGQQSLPGLLPGCSSGLPVFQSPFAGQGQGPLHGQLAAPSFGQVPGQGQLPGKSPALEGFQRLDSAGQLALLQRLTAGKPGNPDNKWAQVLRLHLSVLV